MKLVFLFGLGVAGIIFSVYAAAVVVFHYSTTESGTVHFKWFDPELFFWVTMATLAVIIGGSMVKIRGLRRGGVAVAESLGGRPVDPGTSDLKEKRLINVVEEMALASGIPVPMVYLLDKEPGINAFAAGYGLDDAVVAVTRGCLEQLDRDELQGVVAHEFSHILNGDMRLNIRLIGLISGILVLAVLGRILLRSGRGGGKSKNSGPFVMMGFALVLIGYLGVFMSRVIQSAVSRQREYLSDASAVQFTRNPSGIANALKKIGGFSEGTTIRSPLAVETGHLFFGSAFKSLFATHPPLSRRIRAIDPGFSGDFSDRTPIKPPASGDVSSLVGTGLPDSGRSVDPEKIMDRVGTVSTENIIYGAEILEAVPSEVRDDLRDPFGASCVVYALLMDSDHKEKKLQMAALEAIAPKEVLHRVVHLDKTMAVMAPELKLPVLDLSVPVLRKMSPDQYTRFKKHVTTLVEADKRITLFEFAIRQIIIHRLDAAFYPRETKETYRTIESLMDDAIKIVSKVAEVGHDSSSEARRAFISAMTQIPVSGRSVLEQVTDVPLKDVGQAMSKFASARPGVRRVLLDACVQCILYDRVVTMAEAELMRAVAYSVDLPLPPIPKVLH